MRDFKIISKSDAYFICTTSGMHCRILIDSFSRTLPVGEIVKLHVEEISDKYIHYANDAVFKLTLPYEEQNSIAICTLNTGRKNKFTYRYCIRLGGKWEPILGEWVFSKSVEDRVIFLSKLLSSPEVSIEATFRETISTPKKELSLFGYELVKGHNLNNSPILHKNIKLCSGDISFIPGVNSKTIVRSGTTIRLTIPEGILNCSDFKEDYFAAIKIRKLKSKSIKKHPL
ncbi:hypothetical protein [Vibrio ouci]|uniref:Uncharacterized protein n=1 Tax=Vibrio ouci TaxID=2499078 RepID=A0A4Y8WIL7_9VIBR|nr:hypothetical protein [Vibrio ouci]TFH92168.1 hypothetical protein ELS82_08355 [Vibrio ouci]